MKRFLPHLFVLCALIAALAAGLHIPLRNGLSDTRFRWLARPASGDIVLVEIDSRSIAQIGVWPWPRTVHARLLDSLQKAEAADVVFDVDFSSPSTPSADRAFAQALTDAGGSVVLPSFKQRITDAIGAKQFHLNRPLPEFASQSWTAMVNVAIEPDGLVRRYAWGETIDGRFTPSVGGLLAGTQKQHDLPFWIDFSIDGGSVPSVSSIDILNGDARALTKLKNKKVIVAGTAIELGDRFNVPNGRIIPGSLLQALAAESIVQGRNLRMTSLESGLGAAALVALLMLGLWRRTGYGFRVLTLLGLTVAFEMGAMLLQAFYPVICDTSIPIFVIATYGVAVALDEIDLRGLLRGISEKRFQRIAMSLGDGLICMDAKGLIALWNPGAEAIFGYRRDEILGAPFDRLSAAFDEKGIVRQFSLSDLTADDLKRSGGKILELQGRRKNGEFFALEACFSGWTGTEGLQIGVVLRDISERKREQERIRYLAEHDTLTGLLNRGRFIERLSALLPDAKGSDGEVVLVLVGVKYLQQINDLHGHDFGDRLLQAIANELKTISGESLLLARVADDEFGVLIEGRLAARRSAELEARILSLFAGDPFQVGTRQFRCHVAIGSASQSMDREGPVELLGNAHLALARAKLANTAMPVAFSANMREDLESRMALEAELILACERREFELFYQPQVSLSDGRLIGAEALIRWRHPTRGLIAPASFIPVVNSLPIAEQIGLWVLQTACQQGKIWEDRGNRIRMGVNLSPAQMQSSHLPDVVAAVLQQSGLTASLLELEVTEDIMLADEELARQIFRRIQDLGVSIAFDDFGTGYGSLSYLQKFPLDVLKIDKSFVLSLRPGSQDAAIVNSTISLGKALGLSVIAEGIEDPETVAILADMGCDEGQGYHFGRPMPAAEFAERYLAEVAKAA